MYTGQIIKYKKEKHEIISIENIGSKITFLKIRNIKTQKDIIISPEKLKGGIS